MIISAKILNRIKKLDSYAFEEEKNHIDEKSLKAFYSFLDFLPDECKEPEITLTPDNEIYATWEIHKQLFSFRFYKASVSKDRKINCFTIGER